jgi:hypothetical protein
VKVDRETAEVSWILGNHAQWGEAWQHLLLTPVGELQWQYHQHAADFVPGGVVLFDNGNYRAPAFESSPDPQYSRAVRFTIDEQAMTVEQTFSWGAPAGGEHFFSHHFSDADLMPETGNWLVTSGGLRSDTTPVYEYTHILELSADKDPVFELYVRDEAGSEPSSYACFQADRIPDIRNLADR